jgi:hypothetical protein
VTRASTISTPGPNTGSPKADNSLGGNEQLGGPKATCFGLRQRARRGRRESRSCLKGLPPPSPPVAESPSQDLGGGEDSLGSYPHCPRRPRPVVKRPPSGSLGDECSPEPDSSLGAVGWRRAGRVHTERRGKAGDPPVLAESGSRLPFFLRGLPWRSVSPGGLPVRDSQTPLKVALTLEPESALRAA